MARSTPLLGFCSVVLFVAVLRSSVADEKCCKLGQTFSDSNGHCDTVEVADVNSLVHPYQCKLTAKLCCLKSELNKRCKRINLEILKNDLVVNEINLFVSRHRTPSSEGNVSSAFLLSPNSCNLIHNDDALCCVQCYLGLLHALQVVSQWTGPKIGQHITTVDVRKLCMPNDTSHSTGNYGFAFCCTNAIQSMNHSIKWCEQKPAPCSHRCHEPQHGSSQVQCSCYDGYRLLNDGKTCLDVDECQDLTHDCDATHETCKNTEGGFQCLPKETADIKPSIYELDPEHKCSKGFYYHDIKRRCKDIDECRYQMHNCDLKSEVCRNLLGSFICLTVGKKCPGGFRKDLTKVNANNTGCVDINECVEGLFECHEKFEDCENFIGSYTCEEKGPTDVSSVSSSFSTSTTTGEPAHDPTNCPKGYSFVRFSYQCEDINECRIGQHNCDLSKQNCVNFPGSYSCVSITKEADLVESANNNQSSSLITCPEGFERNHDLNICEDQDECGLPSSPCSPNSYCQNTVGSFVCHCKIGFVRENKTCVDVDECENGLHSCPASLKCLNRPGSYDCVSPTSNSSTSGDLSSVKCLTSQFYDPVLASCINVNQLEIEDDYRSNDYHAVTCAANERIVEGECRQVSCAIGFSYNASESRCQDQNECQLMSPCRPHEKCTNTVGSYRCTVRCNAGYESTASGQSCQDIDECVSGKHSCPPHKKCKNRPGSYSCECPSGFVETLDGQCQDLDECEQADKLMCEDNRRQECVNTLGSYRCQCKPGYKLEELANGVTYCVDIDECLNSELHRCDHLCYNYAGSYKCACRSGFKLAQDGFTCEDIDECEMFQTHQNQSQNGENSRYSLCYHKCVNVPGSFKCVCPSGYESLSEGRICKDINECSTDTVCSGEEEYCLNVHGNYRCHVINCPEGYFFQANGKSKKCMRHLDGIMGYVDLSRPLFYSYNYLAIVSNIRFPSGLTYLDLVAMSGPVFSVTGIKFHLNLNFAKPGRSDVKAATRDSFILRQMQFNRIIVSLVEPLQGPQDLELELTVELYSQGQFGGSSKAMIHVVVSEFEF